jgi:transposase InsO family protein
MLKYVIQIEFPATNNIAEYEGLVTGLRLAKELGIRQLLIRGDSQLVAKQVQKGYDCNDDKMADYLAEVRRMEKFFDGFKVWYVPRLDNRDTDHLAWIASSRASIPSEVIVEKLTKPSIKSEETLRETNLMIIDGAEQQPEIDWMSPIKAYLDNQPISDDNAEIECIARKSRMYHLIDGVLYKQRANGMMMKCISKDEGIQLLREIHSGVSRAHSSWRSIVGKSFRHGFYWPTAKDDVMKIVTKRKECQFFQKQTMKYVNPLRPIDLSYPFVVWGIDIVGILPRALGGFRFLFIDIDTFTKWMEATPVVNITQKVAVKFLQSIIYRFGVPKRVLTDNGTRFKGAKFLRCCADFKIHHQPSSAAHPQTNGQVEHTNSLLLQGMKMRMFQDLEVKVKNWHKELPSVLWALWTNASRAARATPFSLVYGAEVVLPQEVYLKSARVEHFNPEDQAEARELDANVLEERRNTSLSNVRKYQTALKKYYNKSVVQREFNIGDLVLKKDIHTKDKLMWMSRHQRLMC